MIKLQDGRISQILPDYLSKRGEVQALSFAIQQAVKRFVGYCKNIGVLAVLDMAPDYVLDLLALELGTQYYDDSLDITVKRALVKNTLIWYERAGTPSAVEELVASVFGKGEVKEWFEYGDDPYYFKVITDSLLTAEAFEQFPIMLEMVKNARSHIRFIEIYRTAAQKIFCGIGWASVYKSPAIFDGYEIKRSIDKASYIGIANEMQIYPPCITEADHESL